MEQVAEKPKRRERLDTQPRIWRGKLVKIEPTDRDTDILFPIFDRYEKAGLPANYLHALMGKWGGNAKWFAERLSHMACEPNNYLVKPGYQTNSGKARSRSEIYMRSDQLISAIGWHDLMTNMYMAQIQLGARAYEFTYVRGPGIFAKAPPPPKEPPTYDRKNPQNITIPYTSPKGKERHETIKPDGAPFALGKNGAFRFYAGPETDHDTETWNSRNPEKRNTMRHKFQMTLALSEGKILEKLYGIPGPVYFPYVFNNPRNIDNAKAMIYDLTEGAGTPFIILNTFPVYNSYVPPPKPDGAFFRSEWPRAYETPFYMHKTLPQKLTADLIIKKPR